MIASLARAIPGRHNCSAPAPAMVLRGVCSVGLVARKSVTRKKNFTSCRNENSQWTRDRRAKKRHSSSRINKTDEYFPRAQGRTSDDPCAARTAAQGLHIPHSRNRPKRRQSITPASAEHAHGTTNSWLPRGFGFPRIAERLSAHAQDCGPSVAVWFSLIPFIQASFELPAPASSSPSFFLSPHSARSPVDRGRRGHGRSRA